MKNIEEIRKNAIIGIKEKIKKIPTYLSPVNKERLKDMEKLCFLSGNEFTIWMQNNEIMKNPIDVNIERNNKIVKNAGCKTWKEYQDKCARRAGFKDNITQRELKFGLEKEDIKLEKIFR